MAQLITAHGSDCAQSTTSRCVVIACDTVETSGLNGTLTYPHAYKGLPDRSN